MERVEIRQGETNSFDENDAKVVDALEFEGEETEETQAAEERPEWLDDKFKSPEELAKAYNELQAKMSSATPEEPKAEEQVEEEGEEYEEEEGGEYEEEYVDQMSDETLTTYTNEFNANGDLSDNSYEEIEQRFGIPKNIAQAYVHGQRAIQQTQETEIMSTVGGADNYNKMLSWGQKTLPKSEQDAFDTALRSGSKSTIDMAVQGMWARYQSSTGTRGKLIQGSAPTNNSGAFGSIAELTAAMKDPRYEKDHAYRQEVEERLKVSNIM